MKKTGKVKLRVSPYRALGQSLLKGLIARKGPSGKPPLLAANHESLQGEAGRRLIGMRSI